MKTTAIPTKALVTLLVALSMNSYAASQSDVSAEQHFKAFIGATGTEKGAAELMRAHTAGLPASTQNIQAVRQALTQKLTDEETVMLIRILGSMASPDKKTAEQSALMGDLKGFTNSGKKEIARAATFATSRAGYSDEVTQILKKARDSKTLSDDEYFGELSHLVSVAPKHAQQEILTTLAKARNEYSIDILTSQLADKKLVGSLTPETQRAALLLLKENEPHFPIAIGRYGMTDGFRYISWLRSYAVLQGAVQQKTYNDVVLYELNSVKTDPRKVLAFLSSPEGDQFMSEIGRRAPIQPSLSKARAYSDSFPGNQMVLGFANDIGKRASLLKP